MSLLAAVRALVEFVSTFEGTRLSLPGSGQLRDEFDRLDRAVWVKAKRLGFEKDLSNDGGGQRIGWTNLPGTWTIVPRAFHPMGVHAWKQRLFAIAEAASPVAGRDQPAVPSGKADRTVDHPLSAQPPRRRLTGWREITEAVGMKFADRRKLKRLNHLNDGPIRNAGPGTRPSVYETALREWYDRLDQKLQELEDARRDRDATVGETFPYGRGGDVVPGTNGEIKKRRRGKHLTEPDKT
jgi:hypothetical protein